MIIIVIIIILIYNNFPYQITFPRGRVIEKVEHKACQQMEA